MASDLMGLKFTIDHGQYKSGIEIGTDGEIRYLGEMNEMEKIAVDEILMMHGVTAAQIKRGNVNG